MSVAVALGILSASVGGNEQGLVTDVSIAIFTLAAGITSLLGSDSTGIDIGSPLYISGGAAVLGMILIFVMWRRREIVIVTR